MEKQFFLKKTKYMHNKQQAVPVKGLPVIFYQVTANEVNSNEFFVTEPGKCRKQLVRKNVI